MKDDGDGLTVCYIYILEKARYQKERVYISDSFVVSNSEIFMIATVPN